MVYTLTHTFYVVATVYACYMLITTKFCCTVVDKNSWVKCGWVGVREGHWGEKRERFEAEIRRVFFPYSIGRKSPRGSSSFPTYYYFVFYSKYVHSVFSSTGDSISHFPQENSTRTSKCKWWELFHISRDFFPAWKISKDNKFHGRKVQIRYYFVKGHNAAADIFWGEQNYNQPLIALCFISLFKWSRPKKESLLGM